jgi:DNA polymerase-3 subunit beta
MLTLKGKAGPTAAALNLAMLPATEREIKRLPQLGAVRLTGGGNVLRVAAATFDAALTTTIEIEAEGDAALPASRLADLVGRFPGSDELVIQADDKGGATITSGKSKFRLPVIPLVDLPQTLELGEVTGSVEIEAKAVRDLFARPAFAVSTEETRYYLNGIFLHHAGENLVAVGCDAHRICYITTPAATALSTDRALIVHRELAKVIVRLLTNAASKVMVRRREGLFGIEGANFSLVTKLIDAKFPIYERAISGEKPNTVTTNRIKLGESLARFRAAADPLLRTRKVTLRWDADGLHLSSHDNVEDLAAETEGEVVTAIQLSHLIDLVGAVRGDRITFATKDSGSVIAVTDPDDESFAAFQMPIRVE